jgi:hypothetical protein
MKIKYASAMYVMTFFVIGLIDKGLAQKINVTESSETVGGSKKNALVVSIYNSDVPDVEAKWKSLMKEYKGKVTNTNGVFADNAVIPPVNGNNTIDVYAKAEKGKEGDVKFVAAFDLGGAYLNSVEHKDKFNEAKKIVYDFAVKATRESIAGQRKLAEKQMEKLVSQQQTLIKDNEKFTSNIGEYKQRIEDYKLKIKEAEDNSAKNKIEQEKKKQEIDAQKKVVDAATAKEKAVE